MISLSLEFQSDLVFWRTFGDVIDRGEYLVISTPRRRGWYWGNLLLFGAPPSAGDDVRWRELFAREFAHDDRVQHELFAWPRLDERPEVIDPFVAAGFLLDESVALAADSVTAPPHPNDAVDVRPIESDREWNQVIDNHVATRGPRFAIDTYTPFVQARIAEYRGLVASGQGTWYGAFLGDTLAGDLGIFRTGDIARFQAVSTAPEHRRTGVCGTLVSTVSQLTLDAGARQLVMVADENHVAARIYQSVGFRPVDRSAGLMLYPPEER